MTEDVWGIDLFGIGLFGTGSLHGNDCMRIDRMALLSERDHVYVLLEDIVVSHVLPTGLLVIYRASCLRDIVPVCKQ